MTSHRKIQELELEYKTIRAKLNIPHLQSHLYNVSLLRNALPLSICHFLFSAAAIQRFVFRMPSQVILH